MVNYRHQPRKRFGQNFLVDATIVQRIIAAIAPQEKQFMVEIGPGLGVLTVALLPILHKLFVVELDRELIPSLQHKCSSLGELVIYQADALYFDFASLVTGRNKLRVVGNLPYNISSPLIFHLLSQADVIQDMHFMLQQEVANRLVADPGTKIYGRLSVMVQYYCKVEKLFVVDATAFDPQPRVMSTFIRLVPHQELPYVAKNINTLAMVVKQAFSQRRKMLRNTLQPVISVADLTRLNIDASLRPEQITVAEYVKISNAVC